MVNPYTALETTLGRPLTAEEKQQAGGDEGRAREIRPTVNTPYEGWQGGDEGRARDGGGYPYTGQGAGTPPAFGSTPLTASFAPPPAYVAPKFQTLTPEQLASDPSYAWRFNQGQKAYESGAAARGRLRTGGALKDLVNYGQNAASQEYGAANDRALAAFDRNAEGTAAEYAPHLLGWQTQTANDQRNRELQFDRDWQKEIYNRDDAFRNKTYSTDDAYRKMVFMTDDNFRKTVYSTDDVFRKAVQAEQDVWKREVMVEERLRWMAELGAK